METELTLDATTEGAQLLDGSRVVATAVPVGTDFLVDATVEPVPDDEARAAEAAYRGLSGHPFPSCFVCGPENAAGLQLKPGPLGDGRVGCTWVPSADVVEPVFLWAALDCPGGWAIDLDGRPSVLGQLTACVDATPEAGEECVAVGRVLGEEGRKTFTASTLYDSDGRVLARARHTWILVDPALFN